VEDERADDLAHEAGVDRAVDDGRDVLHRGHVVLEGPLARPARKMRDREEDLPFREVHLAAEVELDLGLALAREGELALAQHQMDHAVALDVEEDRAVGARCHARAPPRAGKTASAEAPC
jgi:hypothetical protein